MDTVGQELRASRLRLGITLEQISSKTRISTKALQAIESDDPVQIGSALLYKSFARQFASQLGLDYGGLSARIQMAAAAIPDPLMPGEEHALPKIPPLRASRSRKLRWINSAASLVFMLAGCCFFYGVWQNSRGDLQASVTSVMESLKTRLLSYQATRYAATQQAKLATPRETSTAPVEGAGVPGAANEPDPRIRIELSAIERTWLSVFADGVQTFNGTLEASETKVLEGHESARVRTGNAGGVSVVFNGKPLGKLGERGQVRTVLFTKSGYQFLEPPERIALASFTQIGE